MDAPQGQDSNDGDQLVQRLSSERDAELSRIVPLLVSAFQPEAIYLFGSTARGTANEHSDLDLLIVVQDAGEYPHRLSQEALHVIGPRRVPLDVIFMGREDFDWRTRVPTSLPSTVLREGKVLYGSHAGNAA